MANFTAQDRIQIVLRYLNGNQSHQQKLERSVPHFKISGRPLSFTSQYVFFVSRIRDLRAKLSTLRAGFFICAQIEHFAYRNENYMQNKF
ncbi:hypothetical protein ACIQD3_12540 [Peribacillus loiseleuriae]|uniref:hypothetical protein n=1 Tax=Peribacillus loiseleuriae TaxID=1679170 RepID=UPI0037F3AD6E